MFPQEHPLSCGAACARQLLADAGVLVTEADVRTRAGFQEDIGIFADHLGLAMTALDPGRAYRGAAVDPESLPGLLRGAPFLAMRAAASRTGRPRRVCSSVW